jgi:hypothetical protein
MAAYPTLPTMEDSQVMRTGGHVSARATNGRLKTRKLISGTKSEFALSHWISAAQKATLDSHYSGDAENEFAYTWPTGGSYTVRYLEAPQYAEQAGGWFKARVRLGEV